MSISPGFTTAEIREFVHEYQIQPHGQKTAWLAEKNIGYDRIRRWRTAVFEGDLDRGMIPRHAGPMAVESNKRTAFEQGRADERAVHELEVQRLQRRVQELEETNDALGKAIGLLHARSERESDAFPPMTDPSSSSTPSTASSPS